MRSPLLVTVLVLLVSVMLRAQAPGGANPNAAKAFGSLKGRVYGKLVDEITGKPVEFAAVAVLWINKDSVIGGGLTEDNGDFNIENLPGMGTFRLKAVQIGYKKLEMKIYIQPPSKLEQDLGDLKMSPDEKVLKEVEVVAEKSTVNMSIDKRTYNVDKDLSVKGGTAVDAVKNVPGLTVDGEGNAQLRNQAPMLFVDGRPTNLSLQQIPADQIDRIEVITNPSVKFDASATGGILNIVMKKNVKPGYNGMVMAYIGTGDRYGGMLNLNVKEGKWNFSAMYNYNQAINLTKGYTKRMQLDSGTVTSYFNQDNETWQTRKFNFGKFGVDYAITNRNTISLNQMIMGGWFTTNDRQHFEELDSEQVVTLAGDRVNEQASHFINSNTQLMYKRTYAKPGKELTADISANFSTSDNDYLFTTYAPENSYQKNLGYNDSRQGVFQLDFVNPLGEFKKLETGVKAFYKQINSGNNTSRAFSSEDNYIHDSALSNQYVIDDMVNAAYVNYSSKTVWDIRYQAGMRFEQSLYKGQITDHGLAFEYNYPGSGSDVLKSLFPGVYLSRKFSRNQEWQLNFSRKIQRPNFFQLMPFVMFADRYNYRIGNPQLKPEFRNISELNYSKTLTKGSYLGSAYFRYEEQPITEVAYPAPDDPNVLINTSINGENSYRYGMEHTLKYNLFKKLDVTFNANVYSIYVRGLVIAGEPVVTASGYAFDTKAIFAYRLPRQLTLQLNGSYESPRVLLLGSSLPVYSMDFSVAKMIGTKWTLNLSLNDIFNTRRMGAHYKTPHYEQELSRRRESRYLRFSASYLFGKMDGSIFKKSRSRNEGQDNMDFGG